MPLLHVEHLRKSYVTGEQKQLEVLRGVSLAVEEGEVVAIVGESGSGKSTLLHVLGTLDRPDAGRVMFRGEDVFAQDNEALAQFRNERIGFIFQFHHLLPEFTALENVSMPAFIQGRQGKAVTERAEELLSLLGLEARLTHRPQALSGGEKQRVAIARALMNEPALVLADEPTGNLDEKTADALHDEILRLSRDLGQTFILVTHNLHLAARTDRILRLEAGQLQAA